MKLYFLYLLNIFYLPCNSHIIINSPYIWGISNGVRLEQPITPSTDNWICNGMSPPINAPTLTLIAGQTYSFQTVCGEKNLNAPGCLIGDWHSGSNVNDYAGCTLGISYLNTSSYKNINSYKYISYTRNCPKRTTNTTFIISKYIQNCNKCVCSWAYAPSLKYSTPQFYHNCFYCNIIGGYNNYTHNMLSMDFINVKNSYKDITKTNFYKYLTYNTLPRNLTNIYLPKSNISNSLISNSSLSNGSIIYYNTTYITYNYFYL